MEIAEYLKEISIPGPPRGLAWDGEAVWVTLAEPRRAVRLDPESGEELEGMDLPPEGSLTGLAWTSQGESPALWQALGDKGAVVELIPSAGPARRLCPVGDGAWIRGLCTDGAAGPTLWFVEATGEGQEWVARAARFDVRDGEVHKRIVLESDAAGLTWDGRWLWYARHAARRLVRVDPMFADALAQLEVDFCPLGLCFDGEALWAADGKGLRIVRIACPPR